MSRNILELKSIRIAPEKVQTSAAAKRLAKLKDFDLKEEYFEPVYHPADLVDNIDYYVEGETYKIQRDCHRKLNTYFHKQ